MTLPDYELKYWASKGGIIPFYEECINPASVDLRISTVDVITLQGVEHTNPERIVLTPGDAILVCTIERIRMPYDCAGTVYLKSSLARQGLDHALAGFVDPGFRGQLTLELHAHCPIVLTHGQRIIQLVLHRLEAEPEVVYAGKYQDQQGPTGAR